MVGGLCGDSLKVGVGWLGGGMVGALGMICPPGPYALTLCWQLALRAATQNLYPITCSRHLHQQQQLEPSLLNQYGDPERRYRDMMDRHTSS